LDFAAETDKCRSSLDPKDQRIVNSGRKGFAGLINKSKQPGQWLLLS
jgi:hypothetical protein